MDGIPWRWLNEAVSGKEQVAAIALSDEACMQRYREKLHRYVSRLSGRESEAEEMFIASGFLLNGKGELLADDFQLEPVDKSVAVTGGGQPAHLPSAPVNLDFSN